MLEIHCAGSPYEIGYHNGRQAKDRVLGSLAFYHDLFKSTCSMDWSTVRQEADNYTDTLRKLCPKLLEEMQGVADGADVDLLDIVALNVRTEIAFGLFTREAGVSIQVDGCTSLACKSDDGAMLLAQNWDWNKEQAPNLIICHIEQAAVPKISMVTEAGIIGKIGLNSNGVGVCLNAIRARGVDSSKLPVHIGLRMVLESCSREEAVAALKRSGIASSAHILIGDATGAVGLESTSKGTKELQADSCGRIVHSNHLLLDHPHVDEPPWLLDSPVRIPRTHKLLDALPLVDQTSLRRIFIDEEGYPGSINRCQVGVSDTQTLFNIVINLSDKTATVRFGRPTESTREVRFAFE